MTEAERSELDMLEGRLKRRELTEFETNRLYFLRMRASGACTWREVLDQIDARLPHVEVSKESPWLQRLIRERHETMLPPPAEDDGELE